MTKQLAAIACIVTVFSASSFAETNNKIKNGQITLSWEDATRAVTGQKVNLVLPNGSLVEGKVLSANADSLTLDVRKTLDSTKQPKGPVAIPRTSLHMLQLQTVGTKYRAILTGVGAGLGAVVGIGAAISSNETGSGNENAIFVVPIAAGVLGFVAGTSLDHHQVNIVIP